MQRKRQTNICEEYVCSLICIVTSAWKEIKINDNIETKISSFYTVMIGAVKVLWLLGADRIWTKNSLGAEKKRNKE